MSKDVEIAVKIPAGLVEQIDYLFDSKALQATGWVPKNRSYEAFLLQAIETEIWGLQDYEASLIERVVSKQRSREKLGDERA